MTTTQPSPLMLLMENSSGWVTHGGGVPEGLSHWPLDPEERHDNRNLLTTFLASPNKTPSSDALDNILRVCTTLLQRGVTVEEEVWTLSNLSPGVRIFLETLQDNDPKTACFAARLFEQTRRCSGIASATEGIQATIKHHRCDVISGLPAEIWLITRAFGGDTDINGWANEGNRQERSLRLRVLIRLIDKTCRLAETDANTQWKLLAGANLMALAGQRSYIDRQTAEKGQSLGSRVIDEIDLVAATRDIVNNRELTASTQRRYGAVLAMMGRWPVTTAALPLLYAQGANSLPIRALSHATHEDGPAPDDFLDIAGEVDGAGGMHAGIALVAGSLTRGTWPGGDRQQETLALLERLAKRHHQTGLRAIPIEDLDFSLVNPSPEIRSALDTYRMDCVTAPAVTRSHSRGVRL